jgi:hypothetical protein
MTRLRRGLGLVIGTPERRLLLAALLIRLIPAAMVYGTGDVQAWETWGKELAAGLTPYRDQTLYQVSWPPLWLPFPYVTYVISELSPLPFSLLIKFWAIAADLIVTMLLYTFAGRYGQPAGRTAWLWALNPVSIYTSAVHGQFDPLPMLCALMAVLHAGRTPEEARPGHAGWWLGIGAAFKTWPLFILPALAAPLRPRRRQLRLVFVAVAVFTAALLLPVPFIGKSAALDVFRYRSAAGWWGLTAVAALAKRSAEPHLFSLVFYGAMAAVALLLAARRTPALRGALLLLLTFYVTTPGFGPQYLVWIVPIALLADPFRATIYSGLAGAVLAFTVLARPYLGALGDTVRVLPHAGYARAIGGPLDRTITASVFLVVWVFVGYWWLATMMAVVRGDRMGNKSMREEGVREVGVRNEGALS